jgi:hypothetical protein
MRQFTHPNRDDRIPVRLSEQYQGFCRALLLLFLFVAALLNGSVSPPYVHISGCLCAALFLLCLPIKATSPDMRTLISGCVILLVFLALWGGIQSLPLPLFVSGHSIWQKVNPILELSTGSLSVNPVRSLTALPALILPGLVFLTTLLLSQSVQGAKRVWISLSLVGAAIVVISIILEVLLPNTQVFTTYKVGFGSFSGVFVNRNVSAAFFGLTAFALTGTLYLLRSSTRAKHRSSADIVKQSLVGLMLFVVLIAIIATRSRAGTLLSLPILFFCVAIIFAKAQRKRRIARALPVLGAGFVLLVLFGEPVFSRLGNTSQDLRWCAWGSTITGILDNFWVGTGFGTFKEVFPVYRDPECLGTSAGWHRAHNSFLEFMFGFGVPAALLAFTLGYSLLLSASLTGLRRRKSLRAIPILTLGALGFVSAHSLVDFPLQIPGVAYYCAALMGAGSAISLIKRPKRHATYKSYPASVPPSGVRFD